MRSVFDLITRLNEIMRELNNLGIKDIKFSREIEEERNRLITEYDEIVLELWGHIPSLKNDVNIQPKKKVRKYENNNI